MLKYYLDKTGKVIKSILFPSSEFVDTEPREGSMNPITSGAVADVVPQDATKDNPLMTAADTERMILENTTPAAKTLRFSFSKLDYSPVVAEVGSSGTWKKVSKYAENNVWDWTNSGTTFNNAFENAFKDTDNLVSIIAAGDTSSVTSLSYAFAYCSSIVSFSLFDTSNVTTFAHAFRGVGCETLPKFNLSKAKSIQSMLRNCSKLKAIPTFDVAVVSSCNYAFYQDRLVESGSKAFYDALIAQVTPPSDKGDCFTYCGDQTTTGAAELAQIPRSWGGLAEG